MNAAGYTDVGISRRGSENQDTIFVSLTGIGPLPNLFIVADGMGGHKAGDVASQTAVETMSAYIRDFPAADFVAPSDYIDLLVNAAKNANEEILKKSRKNYALAGMGTTLTACVILDGTVFIAHVGDSRAYSLSPEGINQLTSDHTYIAELVQAGRITPEEALTHPKRHVITRVLGDPDHSSLDGLVVPLGSAQSVLLCSDGLSNMLDNDRIKSIASGSDSVENRVKFLIDEANNRGGEDNISAVLIDVIDK